MYRIFSPNCYIGMIFQNPRSDMWPAVQSWLNDASFIEKLPDKTVIAGFTRNHSQVELAIKIVSVVDGWKKSVSFFLNGKPTASLKNTRWYDCYLAAIQCGDPEPYCCDAQFQDTSMSTRHDVDGNVVIDMDFTYQPDEDMDGLEDEDMPLEYLVPCAHSASYGDWYNGTSLETLPTSFRPWP